jgi:hypothetical protein
MASSPALAIVGGHPPAADDRRFDAVGAWSHAAWLGLGDNPAHEHNWFGGATLIRPNIVATAKHIARDDRPAGTYAVRFRRRLDGGLGSKDAGVVSYHHALVARVVHGAGDLALAWLVEPVTHITPIAVMQLGFIGLQGQPYIHGGWGQEGPGRQEGPRNQLMLCDQNTLLRVNGLSVSYPALLAGNPPPPCAVNRWDSGGAVLVEHEDDRLWLLATHHTYGGGPTLAPWLGVEGVPLLHRPFVQPDLALEAASLSAELLILEETASMTVSISNPGRPRRGGADPAVLVEMRLYSADEGAWTQIGQSTTAAAFGLGEQRQVEVAFTIPAAAAVGRWSVRARLELDAAVNSVSRNDQIAAGVISVLARPRPFSELGAAMVVRVIGDDQIDIAVVVRQLRSDGSTGFWVHGRSADGAVSFARSIRRGGDGILSLETPFGAFGWDSASQREPLIMPDDFIGRATDGASIGINGFTGVYHGRDQAGDRYTVAVLSDGGLFGGWSQPDDAGQPFHHTVDLNSGIAEGGGRMGAPVTRASLAWDGQRNLPSLAIELATEETVVLWREEAPSAAYAPCREDHGCRAHAGVAAMVCARAADQEFGVCALSGCNAAEVSCAAPGVCVEAADLCMPTCDDDAACALGMSCTLAGYCADCVAWPGACPAPPDAGPRPDAMPEAGAPIADAGSADVQAPIADAGPLAAVDAGAALPPPSPAQGCGCTGSASASLLFVGLLGLLRRRRIALVRG